MKQRRFLAAIAAVFMAIPCVQAEDAGDRAGSARAAMDALRPLAGEWTADVYMWRDGKWGAPEKERTTFQYLLNDLALRKLVPERSPSSVRMETTIQFDQYRDVYRLVAMDDGWGNMDIYEGSMSEPGKIVFTNLRAGTFALGANGEVFAFRLTLTIIDENAHSLLVEISGDEGDTWRPFQLLKRVRLR